MLFRSVERGEIGGFATIAWNDFQRDRGEWLKAGKANVLFQISAKRAPYLPNAPALTELGANDDDRAMLNLLARTEDMGRSFPVGPAVPADRVALLREAFGKMSVDPKYLADGARYDFEFDFMPGEALQAFVVEVGSLPADQRARIRRVLMP